MRRPSFPAPTPAVSGQAGFTLIEVLVTALVVALLAASTATAFIVTSHATGDQSLRAQANTLAGQDQDRLRGFSQAQLTSLAGAATSSSSRTQVVNGTTFTVASKATSQDASGGTGCGAGSVDYFKTTSTVTWNESWSPNAIHSVSDGSVLSRTLPGQLQTTVNDQTGTPIAGATVTATPSSGSATTGQTDSSGCALLTGLATGSYTDGVSDGDYVDVNGNQHPAQTVPVSTTGSSTSASFILGHAGYIQSSLLTPRPAPGNTSLPAQTTGQADAVSWSGGGAGTSMAQPGVMTNASPFSAFTTSRLFPFDTSASTPASYSNNYTAWAGKCPFQQPPPSTGLNTFSVSPAATATTPAVQEPYLYVPSVQGTYQGTTFSLLPSHIVLTYTSGSCTDSYQAAVSSPAGASGYNVLPPANGWLRYPGQPYDATPGTLTICADVDETSPPPGLAAGYYHGSVTTALNSSMTSENSVPTIQITTSTPAACQVTSS